MFKVKATITNMIGDKDKYPCHHQYQLGYEFIFDGASFTGSICPSFAMTIVPKMMELHSAGPRYRDYIHYYPFLYAPQSIDDPSKKKFDGLGYKNIFDNYSETKHSVANLAGSSSFKWPPADKRPDYRPVRLICPDYRTSVVATIEAFDLSDAGRNIPFFRREMSILDKILDKPGIEAKKILNEFSKTQIEEIYPALSPVMIESLLEEMEVMDYLEIKEGRVYTKPKAKAKLEAFKANLSKEERKALRLKD
jgi:uncharacterized repeat protein (TIGR04076 family)